MQDSRGFAAPCGRRVRRAPLCCRNEGGKTEVPGTASGAAVPRPGGQSLPTDAIPAWIAPPLEEVPQA